MHRNFHLAAANEFKSYAKVDNIQNKHHSLSLRHDGNVSVFILNIL